MANKNQEVALTRTSKASDAINVLNEKLENLKQIVETPYKTGGKITTAGGGQKDIKEEINEFELVKALSSVFARIDQIEITYAALGIKEYPVVKIDGGTKDEWAHDGNLRIQIIRQKVTFDKYTGWKQKWSELMDKEDRKELLIKEMEEDLLP